MAYEIILYILRSQQRKSQVFSKMCSNQMFQILFVGEVDWVNYFEQLLGSIY